MLAEHEPSQGSHTMHTLWRKGGKWRPTTLGERAAGLAPIWECVRDRTDWRSGLPGGVVAFGSSRKSRCRTTKRAAGSRQMSAVTEYFLCPPTLPLDREKFHPAGGRKVSAPPREDISPTCGADIDSESSPRLFMFGLMSNPSRSSVHESLLLRGVCTGKRPWYSYGGAEKRIEQTGERCMGTPHTVKIIHTVSQN